MHTAENLDYTPTATPGTLVFNTGAAITTNPATTSQECFTFPIINDDFVEDDETVFLGLSSSSGLIDPDALGSQATVTIIDDDRECIIIPLIGGAGNLLVVRPTIALSYVPRST